MSASAPPAEAKRPLTYVDALRTIRDVSLAVAREGRSFTIDDLDAFPENDGLRYQLLEGTLVVNPAPVPLHQRMATRILLALAAACPPGLEVLAGPAGVVLGPATEVQPDVLVVRRDAVRGAKKVTVPPVLVVEVLSPSTRLFDLGSKRLAYREGGVGAYWLADPAEPRLTTIEWSGDDEVERTAAGAETIELDLPFPVALRPQALVDDGASHVRARR